MLGLAYALSVGSGFVDDPPAANRLFVEYTKKAAELDPFDPFTQAMLGCVRGLKGDPKGAEAAFDRAVALAPNDPDTLMVVAWSLPLIVGRKRLCGTGDARWPWTRRRQPFTPPRSRSRNTPPASTRRR